jgi:hypothetical protein
MHRPLLVANQDVLYRVLLEQFVINEQYRAAGIAEYVFDPLLLQASDYDFSAGKFHKTGPQPKSGNMGHYRVGALWSSKISL